MTWTGGRKPPLDGSGGRTSYRRCSARQRGNGMDKLSKHQTEVQGVDLADLT